MLTWRTATVERNGRAGLRSTVRITAPFALAVAFAFHVGLAQYLTGRLHAAALTAALAAGALFASVLVAGKPWAAVTAMSTRSRLVACAGGLLAFAAAPGIVAAVRMSDAPSGAVTVFWIGGGWAALAAIVFAGTSLRLRSSLASLWSVAGAFLVLAGCAAVVANWERPSSFSPLERFPVQEAAILAGGLFFVVGGLMLARAARDGGLGGPLVCGAVAALSGSGVWWALTGLAKGWSSLTELPVAVVAAALSWSMVCVTWPFLLREQGVARPAALLAASPVLLSALVFVEQAVGVSGPQPMIAGGVLAGALVLACGMLALFEAGRSQAVVWRPLAVTWLAAVPVALATVALGLPAIVASAEVTGVGGSFSGSWTLSGAESIAGWSAVALTLVMLAAIRSERPWWPATAALGACAAWPWLTAVPTHVLNGWLAPGIQQYYGTEYASITFTPVTNLFMIAAVVATGVGLVTLTVARTGVLSRVLPAGLR
jgi:hypothetical protein